MANPTSVAAILSSEEFFESRQKTQRYIHHKFQDYGIRIAEELGDMQHRSIYLSLAKNEDKNLLDIALAFAKDYRDEMNKGKLFMWKLKQLREERRIRQAMTNFEHEFVMAEMSKTCDELCQQLSTKQKQRVNQERETLIHELVAHAHLVKQEQNPRLATKILNLGCGAGHDAIHLVREEQKLEGLDISRQLVNIAQKNCKHGKFVRKKTFLDNAYKDEQFHGIWMDSFWQVVPFKMEQKYLVELHRIMAPGARLQIAPKVSGEEVQKWNQIEWREQTLLSFLKVNIVEKLIVTAERLGFELVTRDDQVHQSTLIFERG